MNFTARPIEEDGVRKIKLADGLVFPLDALPHDLRRRWDIACAHIERGDNVAGAIKAMTREAVEALWPQIMMRVAQKGPTSIMVLGMEEKDKARITDLSAAALEHAREEKRKEGVKESAGEEK